MKALNSLKLTLLFISIILMTFIFYLFGSKYRDTQKYLTSVQVVELFDHVRPDSPIMQEKDVKTISRYMSVIPNSLFFPERLTKTIKTQKSLIPATYTGKGEIDMRIRDTYVVEQWDGTCTAHGLVAAVENLAGDRIKLSERHVWNEYAVYSCDAAIEAWSGKGCITENKAWRHENRIPASDYLDPKYCYTYLKKSKYLVSDIQAAISALDNLHPVYLATSVTNSMLNGDLAINPTSSSAGGGHALSIVGYHINKDIKGGGYFIVKNSWGINTGDKGYQYLPFYHCQRSDLYCLFWSIDEVIVDPSLTPTRQKCIEWRKLHWYSLRKTCVKWSNV